MPWAAGPLDTHEMRTRRALRALPPLLLTVTAAACGHGAGTSSDTASDTSSDTASDTSGRPASGAASEPAEDDLEPITSRGVAAVVRDALGAERITSYSAVDEDGQVGVMVRLARRQVLMVGVHTAGDVPVSSCEDLASTAVAGSDCRTEADGTILAAGTSEAFSDGNRRGSTVLAQSVNPETGRVVLAMYETFAPEPELDPDTLAAIVSDRDLAPMTSPSTNEAGADITMTRLDG